MAYLKYTLEKFGFKGPILNILALYKVLSARIVTNGKVSSFFPQTNGKRQGCPLGPLIIIVKRMTEGKPTHRENKVLSRY